MPDAVVLVADGQRLFAESLAGALRRYPGLDVLGEYPTSGPEAVRVASTLAPDVVLLDYWLPEVDGPAATAAIRAAAPSCKVLVLSWLHGRDQVQQALNAGAAGFLPKSVTVSRVAEAVRRARGGEPLVYGSELAALVDAIDNRHESATRQAQQLYALTPRELQVLQLLGEGQSVAQIADTLSISQGTVRNHTHRILSKTGARSQLEAVAMGRHAQLIHQHHFPSSDRPGPRWTTDHR